MGETRREKKGGGGLLLFAGIFAFLAQCLAGGGVGGVLHSKNTLERGRKMSQAGRQKTWK